MANQPLLCIQEAEYHVARWEKFELGKQVKERGLERSKVDLFNERFEKILPAIIELKDITAGTSFSIAKDMYQALVKTKNNVVKLMKEATLKNPLLETLDIHLSGLLAIKEEAEWKKELAALVPYVATLEGEHPSLSGMSERIKKVQGEGEREKQRESIEKMKREIDARRTKNEELEHYVQSLVKKLSEGLYILHHEIELQRFVTDESLQAFPSKVVEFLASRFVAKRDVTVFQNNMERGRDLLFFKRGIHSSDEVLTYGTDPSITACKEAKKNGVDAVAKKGIFKISHHTFDVSLCFLSSFSFYKPHKEGYEGFEDVLFHGKLLQTLPEEDKLYYALNRNIPRKNGYFLFNVPSFKLHHFISKIRRDLTVLGMYRVDDNMKNILFVTRYKRDAQGKGTPFRKAMLNYDKLPHYTEMPMYPIDKGDVEIPKIFRPLFVDEEDLLEAFEHEAATLSVLKEQHEPTEKLIELSRPLQEYKEGHIPAVATIEIVNGIYDTEEIKDLLGREVNYPCIYATKIVQQDVSEEKEEMYKGEKVTIVSQKKKNVIVSKALLQDGTVVELLNTK